MKIFLSRKYFQAGLLSGRSSGFTVLEVLAVVAIMVIIMAAAIPIVPGLLKASKLRTASNALADYFVLARQTAITRNCRVEVRFYLMKRSEGKNTYSAYRAFTISSEGVAVPLGKIKELDKPIVIAETSAQNTIFRAPPYEGSENLPGFGSVFYHKFSFLPGGRTDFDPGSNWFMTLYDGGAGIGQDQLPLNYVIMQIDDSTGHVRLYRP